MYVRAHITYTHEHLELFLASLPSLAFYLHYCLLGPNPFSLIGHLLFHTSSIPYTLARDRKHIYKYHCTAHWWLASLH